MLPDQFITTSRNLSGRKTLVFMNVFGLFAGLAFLGLVAHYTVGGLQPDAAGIFGKYEWYKVITGQPEVIKNNLSASADHALTAPAISVNNSTASSMVCTPSILKRSVFLTSFKLVRRGLACRKPSTFLN